MRRARGRDQGRGGHLPRSDENTWRGLTPSTGAGFRETPRPPILRQEEERPHHVVVLVLQDVTVPDVLEVLAPRHRGAVRQLELVDDPGDHADSDVRIAREG